MGRSLVTASPRFSQVATRTRASVSSQLRVPQGDGQRWGQATTRNSGQGVHPLGAIAAVANFGVPDGVAQPLLGGAAEVLDLTEAFLD
ncbi:MAG: hypothetical protein WBA45_01960 [Microthrixaceae bacterium]